MIRNVTPWFLAGLFALGAVSASAEHDLAAGKKNFEMLCTSCHGAAGLGDGPAAVALDPKPRDFSVGDFKIDADKDGTAGTDEDLALVVKNGAGAYGGSPLMAPWGHLSEPEIQNIVAYVRSLKQ